MTLRLTFLNLVIAFNCIAQDTPKKKLHMYVFNVGDMQVKDISLWNPGVDVGQQKRFTVSAYLIRHPKGDLIWDTGLCDTLAKVPGGGENERLKATLPKTLISQLGELLVSPSDIDFVAVSHLHNDHIGNMNYFRSATLIVQEEEYNGMFKGTKALPLVDSLKNNKAIRLTGDHDVFGDGSVIIKRAPGHTAGHQVLFVNLPRTGPIVLSGDLWHFEKNRRLRGVPGFNFSKEATLISMDAIEAFIREKKATLWIQHDFEQNQTIPHSPKVIE